MYELDKSNKYGILQALPSRILELPRRDVILIKDNKDLLAALDQPFNVPLFYRAKPSEDLNSGKALSIPALLTIVETSPKTTISVFDNSIRDPKLRTRSMPTSELRHLFCDDPKKRGLNFLYIQNRSNVQFCPAPIQMKDLRRIISDYQQPDKGHTFSTWKSQPLQEFFLLSQGQSLSTVHVDAGGAVTWIRLLENTKIWYTTRGCRTRAARRIQQVGALGVEEHGDWVKIELEQGDLLVMPPSYAHAVFTPKNCLAVGGQFYTAAHLGNSIEGLRLQETCPDISNEDLAPVHYNALTDILKGCRKRNGEAPILSNMQDTEVALACSSFMRVPKSEEVKLKELLDHETNVSRTRFLKQVQTWPQPSN